MGDHMKNAIEQMQKKEEAGLNQLYSKTYNYVYLRAKSLLNKETDVLNLMKDVYVQAFASAGELKEDEVYAWLGKRTYALGTKFYRRKKAREATCFEMDKNELSGKKSGNDATTVEVLGNAMEQLPELYQATFYAFYYDYMTIMDIAEVMDCTTGVILNRLNYTNKFVKESFAMYNEENGKDAKLSFSAESVCYALRKWSVEHCLGMASAQTLYSNICKELNLKSGSIYLEGKEFAGVNNTVVYHKGDDLAPLFAEIELYSPVEKVDKKKIVKIGICVIAILAIIGIVAFAMKGKDSEPNDSQVEENTNKPVDNLPEDGTTEDDMMVEPETNEPADEPVDEPVDEPSDVTVEDGTSEDDMAMEPETDESADYILAMSQEKEVTAADLAGLSKAELRLARNEIYARHGMIFGVDDLDEYFAGKSWYEPKYRSDEFYDEVEMSPVEEKNVQFILDMEKGM